MKIGFDAKRVVSNMTGLGNYSRLVVEEVASNYPADSLFLYTPELSLSQKENPRLARINSLPNVDFRLPYGLGPFGRGALWRSIGITRHFQADGLDVFHGLSNELPLNVSQTGVPAVVTIHDLIYRRLPECYPFIDRKIYDLKYGASARTATRVVAISECTKRDLVELHKVDPNKIDVIYQGCDPQFKRVCPPEEITDIKRLYSVPDNYIIQVGTIERRKNLELSVRALSLLPPNVNLVAVGRDNNYLPFIKKLARQLGVENRITFLSGLPFNHLPALYQGAIAVLYPSLYEGFGIPVLEGLLSRRPVIAATGSCLEEAGGEAAWYVNPNDHVAMADIVKGIINGSVNINTRIGEGVQYASRFDTSNMASALMDTYLKAIDDNKRSIANR